MQRQVPTWGAFSPGLRGELPPPCCRPGPDRVPQAAVVLATTVQCPLPVPAWEVSRARTLAHTFRKRGSVWEVSRVGGLKVGKTRW